MLAASIDVVRHTDRHGRLEDGLDLVAALVFCHCHEALYFSRGGLSGAAPAVATPYALHAGGLLAGSSRIRRHQDKCQRHGKRHRRAQVPHRQGAGRRGE